LPRQNLKKIPLATLFTNIFKPKIISTAMQIPWIVKNSFYEQSYADYLAEIGVSVAWMHYADDALKAIDSQKYPLIIMNLALATGDCKDDGLARMIAESADPRNIYRVGLYVLDRIRAPSSPNVDTPVIVLETVQPHLPLWIDSETPLAICAKRNAQYHCKLNTRGRDLVRIVQEQAKPL